MEAWGADVRYVPKGGLHMQSNNICYYQLLPHAICFVWTDQRKDEMLGLLGWYYMGVPRCIQEDSLPQEPTLLKDKSQVPFFRFYDNTPEIDPPLERRHNGEPVYKMVKTYTSSMERRIQMGRTEIEAYLLSKCTFQETIDLLSVSALLARLGGPPCH